MTKCLTIVLIVILTNLPSLISQQDNYNSGWEKFKKNELKEAVEFFGKSVEENKKKSESLLMLSVISSTNKDNLKAFEYFKQFYELSDDPNPYLFALWMTPSIVLDYGEKKDYQVEFLENLLESGKINGLIEAYTNEILAMHYESVGDFKEASEYFAKLGAIHIWQLSGEFENISESGFDNNYGVLEHPEPDYEFLNEDGAKVKWFNLWGHTPGKWIRFNEHFFPSNSVFFTQTFCKSEVEKNVQFRIGTSGSVKVWINDALVISESKERNNGLDTYITNIKLNSGYNRILVQIGESEKDRSNFLARITDEKGNPIQDLEYTTTLQNYTKNSNVSLSPVNNFAEEFFQSKIESDPSDLLNYILLAHSLMHNDKTYEARKIIKKAMDLSPDCSYFLRQMIEIYIRDGNYTDLSLAYEKLKATDPDNALSLDLLFAEEVESEDYEKAENYLNKIKDKTGIEENYLTKKINLLSLQKKYDEFIKLIDYSYELFPDNFDFVSLKVLLEQQNNKDINKAIQILENYLDDHFNVEATNSLAELYFTQNNIIKGIEELEFLLEYQQNFSAVYKKLGLIQYYMKNYEKALEYYQICLRIAPYKDIYISAIGETYEAMGNKEFAQKYYQKCIYYSPNSYEVRTKLRELLGQKKTFDYFTEPDCYKLYKESPGKENYPEDNSVILLNEVQKVVYDGGGSEEKNYILAKVFNTSGIDEWKEYYIGYQQNQRLFIEKAEVLKKDGNKLDAERSENHVVFTKLEEGDAILLIYRLENYQYGKLSLHFWDKHYFSGYYPFKESKYSLLLPANTKFDYKVVNSDLQPVKTNVDDMIMYVWEKSNQDGLKPEVYMPAGSDVCEILHISSIPDWKFVSDWYYDISNTKSKADFEVKELVNELFGSKKNSNQTEKAKIIYDYIVKNIRYSSVSFRQSGWIPQKASKIINTKIGDCKDVSTLFVALCKEVGIDAQLALVNTRDNGIKDIVVPTIDFNHCIASADLDGKKYYIELTSDDNPFSTVYKDLKKSNFLDIDNKKSDKNLEFLDPPTRIMNDVYRESTVRFENEQMFVEKKSNKLGGYAASMRSTYRDIGEKARKKNLQDILSEDYTSVILTDLNFDKSLDNTSDSIYYTYKYTVNNVFSKISNMMIFKIPWTDAVIPDELFSMPERKYDIELWKFSGIDSEFENITIKIPEGMKLAEVPEAEKYSNEYVDYSITYSVENNDLKGQRIMKIKKDLVPKDKYQEFKDFFSKIIEADTKQFAFTKK